MRLIKSISELKTLSAKKHAVILLCLICLSSGSQAQTVRIVDNNLDNSPNLSIGGTFFGVDWYDPNLNIFLEGQANYRLAEEKGWIKAHYRVAWFDRNEEVSDSEYSFDAVPAEGTKALKNYGLSFGYNFIRKEDRRITRALIINRNRYKSLKLPVKSYRLYGAHAGFESFRSILAQGSTMSYSGSIVANFPKDTIVTANNATPMFNMKIISIGIHRQFVEHSVIESSNSGSSELTKNKVTSMVYSDLLIGVGMMLEDVLVPLGPLGPNSAQNYYSSYTYNYNFYRVNINDSYKKNPVGCRIGWERTSLGKVGFLVGTEFGFRPGIIGPSFNSYLVARLGLMFNMKAK